jgi:threonine/homoserine/homoserine lactone efflux protein
MSPGPSSIVVARAALASRKGGVATALGMGLGGLTFAIAAILGVSALVSASGWLSAILKVLGGAYLIYLGFRTWREASMPFGLDAHSRGASRRILASFVVGVTTQISNPKTAIVYASVFASLLSREVPDWAIVTLPALVFLIETGWYAVLAIALAMRSPRACYMGAKAWIDRAAGGAMSALGAKLVLEARQP